MRAKERACLRAARGGQHSERKQARRVGDEKTRQENQEARRRSSTRAKLLSYTIPVAGVQPEVSKMLKPSGAT